METLMQHATIFLPLSTLTLSPMNARPASDHGDTTDLQASILEHGLIQPIRVVPASETISGMNEVTVGGRRLRAMMTLAEEGKIDDDYSVACVIEHGEDVDVQSRSVAENVVRRAMSPVVEYESFVRLEEGGKTVDEIAAAFGTTVRHVKQRLALGKAAPCVRAALKKGDITLDAAKAFTLGTIEEQEAIFESRPLSQLQAWYIKQQLVDQKPTMRTSIARFVGPDDYQAAGGPLRRDLFSDDVVFEDRALLERLAAGKLEKEAEKLKAEGWGWVIATVERDCPDEVSEMARARPTIVERTEEEKARLQEIDAKLDAIHDDEDAEEDDEYDALYEEREELSYPRTYYTKEQMAKAGVVLTIDHAGEIRFDPGFVRPEDQEKSADASQAGTSSKGKAEEEAGGPCYSGAVLQDIRATNAHVLGAALLDEPDVALRYMMFVAARDALKLSYYWQSGSTLTAKPSNTAPEKNDLSVMATAAAIEEKMARIPLGWLDLPIEEGWEAFLSLSDDKVALVATAVARATMLSFGLNRGELPEFVARSVGADIRQHWRPTAKNFLGRIRKDQILNITERLVSDEAQLELGKMKKKDLAKAVEEIFAGATDLEVTDWDAVHAWRPEGGLGEAPAVPVEEEGEDELAEESNEHAALEDAA
jgi:ParB family chromosome partitioning protein